MNVLNYPKISVIVPIFNLEKYVEDTVNSLLAQTYKNIEIILVDDGSTDNSPEICDCLAEQNENIKIIHQNNLGVSAARNAGVSAASGELIGFCDGDDTVDNDMYEFLYNLIVKDNADIALCNLRVIMPDGSIRNLATDKYKVWDNRKDFLTDFFNGNVKVSVDTKLFKKEICEKIQFPVNYKTNEDKYYCFLASLHAKRISCNDVAKYTYYRRKGSSSFTKFNDKYFDCIKLADKMLDIIKDEYPQLIENAKGNRLAATLRIYKLMCTRNGLENYKSDAEAMINYIKQFDKKSAKKYLSKKDYIRYRVLCTDKKLFLLMTKLIDRY